MFESQLFSIADSGPATEVRIPDKLPMLFEKQPVNKTIDMSDTEVFFEFLWTYWLSLTITCDV